jgi:hypothetical protein
MKPKRLRLLCLLIGFSFATLIWQVAEIKLADSLAKLSAQIFGHSLQETSFTDSQGIPVICIPGVGKVDDPLPIALEANRLYRTRIEPERLKTFLSLSERLEKNLDINGMIPQPYDFPQAGLKKPWFNAPSQAATLVALANRAGYLRNPETFLKARFLLEQLRPETGSLSSRFPDGGIWFWEFTRDEYSLKGMLQTLLRLKEYNTLVGDSLSAHLISGGIHALEKRLPQLTKKGWLNDRYHYKNKRSEHQELVSLLQKVNEITPDSLFTPTVINLSRSTRQFILWQLIQSPAWGRIIGFLFTWLLLFWIAYLFLKPRPHKIIEPELTDSQ